MKPPLKKVSRFGNGLARFAGDQSGQGIILAAASLVLLVAFVALVFNIGRVVDRRTKVQLAADAAAYSGAMVEANSLSAIAWINSAMAQLYYNACKYAADVNTAFLAAELERKENGGTVDWSLPQARAYRRAFDRASQPNQGLKQVKNWMLDLSRIENAIAILTPRLVQEEMFGVATYSDVDSKLEAGADALSFYPAFRMFPHPERTVSYRIERLPNGWRITNLHGGNNGVLSMTQEGNSWHLLYSQGVNQNEVTISQETADRWHIRFDNPPGTNLQEIYLQRNNNLGWVFWGTAQGQPIPPLSFQPVDMDGDGVTEGTLITEGSSSTVFRRDANGQVLVWDNGLGGYGSLTSNTTTIAGVNVQVNVSNVIHFGSDNNVSATIGDPTTVNIAGAQITLTNPPTIHTSMDMIRIDIRGFDPNSFSVTAGRFSLTVVNANGRWYKDFDPREEIWSRQRLKEDIPNQQWQYDYEVLGALLSREGPERFVQHAFWDRGLNPDSLPWTKWFNVHNPSLAEPFDSNRRRHDLSEFDRVTNPDGSYYFQIKPEAAQAIDRDSSLYYLTSQKRCAACDGKGGHWRDIGPNQREWKICEFCEGKDWTWPDTDGNPERVGTEPRVFLADFASSRIALVDTNSNDDYRRAKIFVAGYNLPRARMPLVLNDDFFKFGINVGAWIKPESTIFWPSGYEGSDYDRKRKASRNWGTLAISCARVGVMETQSSWRYQFDTKEQRANWCALSPNNLYAADVRVRLNDATDQIREYDFDDDLLAIAPVQSFDSSASYLWDAIISGRWVNQFQGQPDPSASQISNLQNRAGDLFDFRSRSLQDVIAH